MKNRDQQRFYLKLFSAGTAALVMMSLIRSYKFNTCKATQEMNRIDYESERVDNFLLLQLHEEYHSFTQTSHEQIAHRSILKMTDEFLFVAYVKLLFLIQC